MNLLLFISHLYRSRVLTLSAICLGLGFLFLSPIGQRQAYATARLPDYRTIARFNDHPLPRSNDQTNPTPTPIYNPTATPPTQGGNGKNLFYLYCMACHGDQGQGLTDEFRNRQYPPEDTNCWKSGCHGPRPYEDGFTLPKTVPALIGDNTLTRFQTAQNLYDFIRTAMPFDKPGSLSDEQYLQLLAFLLEQNRLAPEGVQLAPASLSNMPLRGAITPTPTAPSTNALDASSGMSIGAITVLVVIGACGLYWIIRSRSPHTPC